MRLQKSMPMLINACYLQELPPVVVQPIIKVFDTINPGMPTKAGCDFF